ncbi:MAG: HYR domain-containing protein [Sphingobacteriales bacterium]|nr:HYR domain-containing protein [Sphingobacteriales bacterium]
MDGTSTDRQLHCIGFNSLTSIHASGSTFALGTTTVTYTATDAGNVSTCSFTVTVTDTSAPTFTAGCGGIVYCQYGEWRMLRRCNGSTADSDGQLWRCEFD